MVYTILEGALKEKDIDYYSQRDSIRLCGGPYVGGGGAWEHGSQTYRTLSYR